MHITTLLGSAKKKGNTATVLRWIEEELQSLGHTVTRIHLNNANITGCLGCNDCKKSSQKVDCVQKDDGTPILEQMVASDAVLFASPIYFWEFSAQIKALIDRSQTLATHYATPNHTSLMERKRVGLLVTGADSYENNAEGMFTAFDRIAHYYLAEKKAELYVGDCSSPENFSDELKEQAVEFARSLVG